MTTEQVSPTTLAEQIAAFKAGMITAVPADVVDFYNSEIDALVRTGIDAGVVREGAMAPDFTLPNVDGRPVILSDLLQQGPVVLAFYRGDWCPYCNLVLRAYQAILPRIHELGASLVAISPQTPDNSLSTAEKKELTFPVLSDAGNGVARRYGLVFAVSDALRARGADLRAYNGDDQWELPMPGTFVVAPDGTITLAFASADWTQRLEPAAILDALHRIAGR